jgi:quercetin dioxygenase-like cupin family protein
MRNIILTLALFAVAPLLAQDHAKVDPDRVTLVAETDQVRVLRYRYEPHQKSARHSHPDGTIDVAITKGSVQLISPDGTAVKYDVEAGAVHVNRASTHIVENLGDTAFEGLSIEPRTPRK